MKYFNPTNSRGDCEVCAESGLFDGDLIHKHLLNSPNCANKLCVGVDDTSIYFLDDKKIIYNKPKFAKTDDVELELIELRNQIYEICQDRNDNRQGALSTIITNYLIYKSNFYYQTMSDTEEIMFYKDGVYVSGGEQQISRFVQTQMNKCLCQNYAKNNLFKEILSAVRRLSYISRKEFDNDENLICVQNGILNILTNKLQPHSHQTKFLNKTPITYVPAQECHKILSFFRSIMKDQDIPIIQEFLGYCLFKSHKYHKALIILGEGRNGKSTFLNLFTAFLGENNISKIPLHQLTNNRFAASNLYGKSANIFSDIDDTDLKSTGMFKALTGGDHIQVEQKFKNSFSFVSYAKQIFSANQLPFSHDDHDGFYRRWILIHFPNVFNSDNADPDILQKMLIQEELSGLLNWALQGLTRLRINKAFTNELSSEQIRELYHNMSNPSEQFIEEFVYERQDSVVSKKELYDMIVEFCKRAGFPPPSKRRVTVIIKKRLKVTEHKMGTSDREWYWKGIAVFKTELIERFKQQKL